LLDAVINSILGSFGGSLQFRQLQRHLVELALHCTPLENSNSHLAEPEESYRPGEPDHPLFGSPYPVLNFLYLGCLCLIRTIHAAHPRT
jgi:hypothetical protein